MQFYYGGTYCKSRDFWMRTELWTKFFGTSEIRSPFYPWKPGILRQIFGRFMSINIVSATSYRDWSDLSFLNLICVRILVISEFLKKQACIPIISFLVFLFPRVLHSAIFLSIHCLFPVLSFIKCQATIIRRSARRAFPCYPVSFPWMGGRTGSGWY